MNDTMDLDVRLPNDGEHEVRTVAGAVPVVAPAVPDIVGAVHAPPLHMDTESQGPGDRRL